MHALNRFSMVITFAALSLSGSAAWAAGENSFVATAELDGLTIVPPKIASVTAALTLPFRSTKPTTTGGIIAQAPAGNPWRVRSRRGGDEEDVFLVNIRLYFGQHFANGLPIATLCDDAIPKLKCNEIGDPNAPDRLFEASEEFELRDIQFQEQQAFQISPKTVAGVRIVFLDRRLPNDKNGLKALRALIKEGLIYVVINSAFTAKLCPDTGDDSECPDDNDPETDDIMYTPPAPKGGIVIDGDLRGTLEIPRKKR